MARKQSEILGLFATPMQARQLEEQRITQAAQRYTDPIAQQIYESTAQLGGGLAGLFGAKPESVRQAERLAEIRESVPFDPKSQSTYYNTLAQRLLDQGMYGAGYQALQLGQEASAIELEKAQLEQKQDPKRMSLSQLLGIPANVLQNYDAEALKQANQIKLEGLRPGETMADFIGRINTAIGQPGDVGKLEDILKSVPFDPTDAATYYATVAEKLINSEDAQLIKEGYKYLEQANEEKDRIKKADDSPKLSAGMKKIVADEDSFAASSASRSQRALSIAARYAQIQPVGGTAAQVKDALVRTLGQEEDIQLLRDEFEALSAERALSRVPPGPASDKDILFAQRGFPTAFTNSEAIAKFLRGYAKMEALKAAYHDDRARFIVEKGNPGGHISEWRKYRNENMAKILEEYGFTFNDTTIDQESKPTVAPSKINVANDFDTVSRTSVIKGGRSEVGRR